MYQLGLAHLEPPAAFAEFRRFMIDTIAAHGIRSIAEEMSWAALKKWSKAESVPCGLAAKLRMPHRYCDREPHQPNPRREEIWIEELRCLDVFPVLFIFGSDHVDTFTDLLLKSGFQPFIVARAWKAKRNRLTNQWS
jgi:hypothetical protein